MSCFRVVVKMPSTKFRLRRLSSCCQAREFSPPPPPSPGPTVTSHPSTSTAVSLRSGPPSTMMPLLAPEQIKEGAVITIEMYDLECTFILVSSLKVESDRPMGWLSFLGVPDPHEVKVGTYLVPFIGGTQWLVVVSGVEFIGGRHIVDVSSHVPNAFYIIEHTPPGTYHLFRSGDKIEPSTTPSTLDSPKLPLSKLEFFKYSIREKSGSRSSTRESQHEMGTKRLRPFGTKLVDVWQIGEGYYEMFGPEELVPFKPLLAELQGEDSDSVF
ncbi:hypothetical protein BKA70DRAFT_1491954 [Coprinopsis sp. MPI-PUGE-AT-0042]|nr:hypothetical protein BKA70DRAFT_1491954 [Coprinopsis sp. MPI-PUGE-AT-0042]